MEEMRSVLGSPRSVADVYPGSVRESWNYGEKWLKFKQGVVIAIAENDSSSLDGHGCKLR